MKRSGWGGLAGVSGWGLKTDHWFYGLFQSAPDLIALLTGRHISSLRATIES